MATKVMADETTKKDDAERKPHVDDAQQLNEQYNALNKHDGRGFMFFSILFRTNGSVVPQVFPIAFFSACLAASLLICEKFELVPVAWLPVLLHPIAVQMFSIVLGYVIVLRSNLAVSRYFEAISNVQFFGSKWVDAFTQLAGFMRTSAKIHYSEGHPERVEILRDLMNDLLRWFSVMHGLAINSLQVTQLDLDEDEFFDRLVVCPLPKIDFRTNAVGAFSEENMASMSTSLSGKRSIRRSVAVEQQEGRRSSKDRAGSKDTPPKGSNDNLCPEIICMERPTTTNQSSLAPLTILGGLTDREEEMLRKAEDKIDLAHSWVIEAISQASLQADILTQPPILSRVYQELSNGMLGYNQAFKIALVQFPFAFAQMLTLFLSVFIFACPTAVYAFTGGEVLTPALTLFTVLGFWGIHEIAVEVENPFGTSPNQLPMKPLHDSVCVSLYEASLAIKPDRRAKAPKDAVG